MSHLAETGKCLTQTWTEWISSWNSPHILIQNQATLLCTVARQSRDLSVLFLELATPTGRCFEALPMCQHTNPVFLKLSNLYENEVQSS